MYEWILWAATANENQQKSQPTKHLPGESSVSPLATHLHTNSDHDFFTVESNILTFPLGSGSLFPMKQPIYGTHDSSNQIDLFGKVEKKQWNKNVSAFPNKNMCIFQSLDFSLSEKSHFNRAAHTSSSSS